MNANKCDDDPTDLVSSNRNRKKTNNNYNKAEQVEEMYVCVQQPAPPVHR